MKTVVIKDLMVPLSEYATVKEDATLQEVATALKAAQARFRGPYPHRAVLVLDDQDDVVGKVGLIDILRALEPKYDQLVQPSTRLHTGFTRQFLKSLMGHYQLWQQPLGNICRIAAGRKIKNFMVTPSEGEFVDENATLDEAIHQLVMGHHQSVLVLRQKKIVGILRLTDVFETLSNVLVQCPRES
ncbi:MAG: CBS domain-containing protein [Desulfobacterales bacterium]|jgi:CBS domain-containing protein